MPERPPVRQTWIDRVDRAAGPDYLPLRERWGWRASGDQAAWAAWPSRLRRIGSQKSGLVSQSRPTQKNWMISRQGSQWNRLREEAAFDISFRQLGQSGFICIFQEGISKPVLRPGLGIEVRCLGPEIVVRFARGALEPAVEELEARMGPPWDTAATFRLTLHNRDLHGRHAR